MQKERGEKTMAKAGNVQDEPLVICGLARLNKALALVRESVGPETYEAVAMRVQTAVDGPYPPAPPVANPVAEEPPKA